MIKIAFFDVDGTLLRLGHKELSANTAAALRQLHQNGIILCMATGRSYTGVPHFDGIDFDVLLTFNGSFVTAGNDIIFKNPINEHDKYQIISNLKQMNRAIAISNEHMIVTNGTDPDLEQYFAFGSEKLKIADNFDDISKTDIYQIMCSCQKDEHSQILSGAPHSQITAWWDKAVDIIPSFSTDWHTKSALALTSSFALPMATPMPTASSISISLCPSPKAIASSFEKP